MLHVCENAARNLDMVDYDEKDDKDSQFMKVCFDRLLTRLQTLQESAKADSFRCGAFYNVLEKSHSMRVEYVGADYKNKVRKDDLCMSCGRYEQGCVNKISLSGPLLGEWKKECKLISHSWKEFENRYNRVYEKDFVKNAKQTSALPVEDYGDFMIGNTCLRKAQLTFLINTFIIELVYDMALEAREDSLDKDKLYFCEKHDAKKLWTS